MLLATRWTQSAGASRPRLHLQPTPHRQPLQRARPRPVLPACPRSTTVTATFSEAVQSNTINITLSGPGSSVSGNLDYDSGSRKATFTPNAALAASTTYTANVSGAKDLANNTMSPVSWSFTTAAASSGCPCTIWPSSATPAVAADPDNGGIEVGVKFRTTQAGTITKIRFYKGTRNTGTHVGSLWTRTGTKLASVTFTGESPSGWQEATFATPVTVAANTTYVASYYAPAGHYSVSENYFTSATTRGPLTALQNGTDGVNGVYRYGTSSGFPTLGLSVKQLLGRRRPDDELATTSPGDKLNAFIGRGRIRTEQKHPADSLTRACPQLRLSRSPASRSRPRQQPAHARSSLRRQTPPADPDSDTAAVELGVKFRADQDGVRLRHPVLQRQPKHGHPHRLALEQQRHSPGYGDFYRRERERLAAGELRVTGGC